MSNPFALFVFAFVSLLSAAGFTLAGVTLPLAKRFLPRWVRACGVLALVGDGLAHFALAVTVLFKPDLTASQLVGAWYVVALHAVVGLSICGFMLGMYLAVGYPPDLVPVRAEDHLDDDFGYGDEQELIDDDEPTDPHDRAT